MASDLSSDSDEEFIYEVMQILPRPRQIRVRTHPVTIYTDEDFKIRYRFSKAAFRNILQIIEPMLTVNTQRGLPVSPEDQLLIALRFYATGSFQKIVGDHMNLSTATICRVLHKVSEQIAHLRPQYIDMPRGQEIQRCKTSFFEISQFPGVIGAIDCTHVRVQSPGGPNAELFRNRKGYFSINVQAVCDAKLRFRNIIARWPGSVHDSTIFNDCALKIQLEAGEFGNSYLLGDNGYSCKKYLLTPLSNPLTPAEIQYNEAHIRTRNTVERMFGVWKRRFPCMSVGMRTTTQHTLTIIIATAVLHNIAIDVNDNFNEVLHQGEQVVEDPFPIPVIGDNQGNNATRTGLINTYFTR